MLRERGIMVWMGDHDKKTAAAYRLDNIAEIKIFLEGLVRSSA
jgi:hypothetical protein